MKKGFTLIELLIVIAIILILIAIALPNFLAAQIRAEVARAAADERSIAVAMESYNLDRGTYTDDGVGGSLGSVQLTTPIRYISEIPIDPFGIHRNGGGNDEGIGNLLRGFYPMGTGINPKTAAKRGWPPYPPGFSIDHPPYRECYIIYSSGPWDQEPGGGTGPFPLSGSWTIYSPTNGTNSYGGIITTGGAQLELPSLRNLRETHI